MIKPTRDQLDALAEYIRWAETKSDGRTWKQRIMRDWLGGGSPWDGPWHHLQQLRNQNLQWVMGLPAAPDRAAGAIAADLEPNHTSEQCDQCGADVSREESRKVRAICWLMCDDDHSRCCTSCHEALHASACKLCP